MTDEHVTIIKANKPKLTHFLIPRHYKAELEAEILTCAESDDTFRPQFSAREQADVLLTILITLNDAAYYKFGKILCKAKKPFLAQLLVVPKQGNESLAKRQGNSLTIMVYHCPNELIYNGSSE